MKTVGEILRNERLKKKLALSEVEGATKIKVRFLEALEKNDFSKIAEATVVRGFIKNYAEFLGLSSRDLLAIFRRDFIEDEKGKILPRGVYEPLYQPNFSWTPKLTIGFGVGALFFILATYLAFQLLGFLGSPPLEIYSPANRESLKTNEVRIQGKTSPDAVVFINGEMALVLADGSFEKTLALSPGENKILIEALSRRGKKTKIERTIYFGP
ncbi:MAG: helix-turn-helix domain-containing protein [Patescibacteria group bacterium]